MYLRSAYASSNVGVAYNWARTVALSNSAMNPWIYCFRMAEFRDTYKKLMRCGVKTSNRDRDRSSERYEVNKPQSSN